MHFYDALLNFTIRLEPDENFGISTCSLQMSCSASELIRHIMVTCAGILIVFGSGVDDFRQDLANRQQVHAPIGSFLGGFSKSASPNRTVELRGRLELPTYGLRYHCSTN